MEADAGVCRSYGVGDFAPEHSKNDNHFPEAIAIINRFVV